MNLSDTQTDKFAPLIFETPQYPDANPKA